MLRIGRRIVGLPGWSGNALVGCASASPAAGARYHRQHVARRRSPSVSQLLKRKLEQAEQRLRAGDAQAAAALCEQVLAKAPRNPAAAYLLGVAYLAGGRAQAAVPILERVVAADAGFGSAWEHLGLALLMCADFPRAERALRQAAALAGAPASVFMRLGIAILEQDRAAEAVEVLRRSARLAPRDPDVQLNLGRALAAMQDLDGAQRSFEAARGLAPERGEAPFNLGLLAAKRGEPERARTWFEAALAREPQNADALAELARLDVVRGDVPAARERWERALGAQPEHVPSRLGLAGLALGAGRIGEAVEHLQAALRSAPQSAPALAMLADALFEAGELEQAQVHAEHAIAQAPADPAAYATLANIHIVRSALAEAIAVLESGYERTRASHLLGMLVYQLRQACDWQRWETLWKEMVPLLETSDQLGSPFWLLCEPTTPAQQLGYARRSAAARFGHIAPARIAGPKQQRERVRLGYISSDLQQHAVAYLIAEVLERHDRARFEIFAYSYGPEDGGAMRPRLRAACEHFIDIAHMSEDEAVQRIRADALDILVDLKGYTAGERLGILAHRPCALQLTWLGYPGTTGASFIDYAIVDPVLVPREAEVHYSERILRMPHCYQPNDKRRPIAVPLRRADYGLPENGRVFCCFNQTYKITPEVFAVWMRLLAQVPASVLWLFESQPLAAGHLQTAAAAHGIEPSRIVFAPKLPNADHLARYQVADLALDTFPYTSHTTLSDALWCGCPGVVLCGDTFAARVSASIAASAGLREIITHSLADYERLLCELALDPQKLAALRARVEQARRSAPLFDSEGFVRDLENLYRGLLEQ